jgi:oxalate decarboxylase/phosphoglucose isomerase-like protein (cupin superfamily)
VVFIPGDAEHCIWNTGQEEDLTWLYVFATDKFQDVVYRFSDEPKAKL